MGMPDTQAKIINMPPGVGLLSRRRRRLHRRESFRIRYSCLCRLAGYRNRRRNRLGAAQHRHLGLEAAVALVVHGLGLLPIARVMTLNPASQNGPFAQRGPIEGAVVSPHRSAASL